MKKIITIDKVIAFFIVLLPLLDMYSFPFVFNGMGTFIQFILIILLFVNQKKAIGINEKSVKGYFVWSTIFVLTIVVSAIANLNMGFNYRKLFSFFFILLIIFLGTKKAVNVKLFVSFYVKVAIACSLYAIIQTILARFWGVFLPQKILPIDTVSGFYDAGGALAFTGYYRAPSFFAEPAVFAQYVIPALCLCLHRASKKRIYYLYSVIISVGIVASTSSLGIIIAALLWIVSLYYLSGKNIIKWAGWMFIFALVGIVILNTNVYISDSIKKILDFSDRTNGKVGERIYRGFAVYGQLPIFNQFLGIGLGNAESYTNSLGIVTIYDSRWGQTASDYFNNASSSLIYGGFFGLCSFILAPLSFVRVDNSRTSRLIAIVFIIIGFGSSMFFNNMFVLYIFCMICTSKTIKHRTEQRITECVYA